MKKMFGVSVAVAMLAFASVASAATSSGTLTVTGTVESSISLTVESAGGTTSGTGTAAATSALGSISKYGSAPTGFTLARGASNWTISSTVGVQVDKANLTSTDYTLTAQLGSAPASGVTWKLNGSTLSDSATPAQRPHPPAPAARRGAPAGPGPSAGTRRGRGGAPRGGDPAGGGAGGAV